MSKLAASVISYTCEPSLISKTINYLRVFFFFVSYNGVILKKLQNSLEKIVITVGRHFDCKHYNSGTMSKQWFSTLYVIKWSCTVYSSS